MAALCLSSSHIVRTVANPLCKLSWGVGPASPRFTSLWYLAWASFSRHAANKVLVRQKLLWLCFDHGAASDDACLLLLVAAHIESYRPGIRNVPGRFLEIF